jgi:hypothetical protein
MIGTERAAPAAFHRSPDPRPVPETADLLRDPARLAALAATGPLEI